MSSYQYNVEQSAAITYSIKSLLVLAGAGTGKTTTIIGRIAHLIRNEKISSESILALTFTNEAASHLRMKLAHEIGGKADDVHICTFHAFAQLFTTKNYMKLGYSRSPRLINQGDIYYLIQNRFDELKEIRSSIFKREPLKAVVAFKKIFEGFSHNLLTDLERKSLQIDELKSLKFIDDERQIERINQIIDIVEVFPYYQKWKKEEDYVDYGDLIINLWDLINRNKGVCENLQKQYQHIIVDEFQDNNYALSQIVKKIAEPENSIMVVGDDDQCIYAFRQANIQNIYQFKKYYQINDEEHITLSNNYRSNQFILNLANDVISKNSDRLNNNKLIGIKQKNDKPRLFVGSEQQQLFQMLEMIQSLIKEGENPENIAILLRTHGKCKLASNAFIERGMQTSYQHEKLFENSVIKDIIALLNIWASTNKMDHAFLRILEKFIGNNKMLELTLLYDNVESDMSLIDFGMMQVGIIGINATGIMEQIRSIKTVDLLVLLREILKIYKIFDFNDDSLKVASTSEVIYQFTELVKSYNATYVNNRIDDFLDYINIQFIINDELLHSTEDVKGVSDIKIMTMHSAKGLEFNHVFIPFLRSNIFPTPYKKMEIINRLPISWQRWDDENKSEKELHLEEERRLFYVAITRAMKSVTLLCPPSYKSVFIKELDEKNIIVDNIMHRVWNSRRRNELKNKIERNPNVVIKKDKITINSKNLILSASSINIYDQCPLQYKYKYINKIPDKVMNPYLELGKIIHLVIEKFHKNKLFSLKELMNLLNQNWENNSFKLKQEETQWMQDAKIMLENYWNYYSLNLFNNYIIEYAFSFKRSFVELKGRCDFIGIDDNRDVVILDYKTSKKSKSEKELQKDIQLGIYALFMLKKGININGEIIKGLPRKLSILYLREESPEVSVSFSEEDVKLMENKIDDVGMKIQEENFNPCKGRYCDWCNYREFLCPEFN